MIKISKDLTDIPDSLKPSTVYFFIPPIIIPRSSRITHSRRQELVNNAAYIDKQIYNSRYKYHDIKEVLFDIYNKKCAFCEQRIEVPHIEHFRPKNTYYWLAYSWDNLILACPTCNTFKSRKFLVAGTFFQFQFDPATTFQNIHRSCAVIDVSEKPVLVNPEVEDLSADLIFNEYGEVKSTNARLQHTIEQCMISRDDLCYQRKKILDDFKKDIERVFESCNDPNERKIKINAYIEQFYNRSQSSEESFLAFRNHAISKNWIGQIIKDLN